MAEMKTIENEGSVTDFLSSVENKRRKQDSFVVLEMMQRLSEHEPKMWGPSIVGFGKYHYKYESGREGDFFITGFSPRKQNLSIYIVNGFDRYAHLLKKLGKYKTSKVCLYINKLDDIDLNVLEELVKQSVEHFHNKYGK